MSALTTEWQKTGPEANSIKYTVSVKNFRHQMNTFPAGRPIWSKDFKVGRSIFCLAIYPSGQEKNSSHVSVYLHNKSDWDVFADVCFEVGDITRELEKQRFAKKDCDDDDEIDSAWGVPAMVRKKRCHNGDLLIDGCFQLEVFIEVDDEEVLPSHNVEDEAVSKMKSLVNKFEAMGKMIEKKFTAMDRMIENKFTAMDQRLATIEAGNYGMFFLYQSDF